MRFIGLVLVPSLVLGLVLAVESSAEACSGCFDPSAVAPSSGTAMPANAVGIAWDPSSELPAGVLPVLYDVETDQELPVEPIEVGGLVFVRPLDAAEPGRSYRFETPADGCSNGRMVTLEATELEALPEVSLGTLVASEPTLGNVSVPADISCYEDVEGVRVDIELQLAPELQPFVDVLMYETYLDGERWSHNPSYFHEFVPGSSWTGERGADRLVELCIDGVGGSPEPHTVQMMARVVGAPEIVYESSMVEVVLDCAMFSGGETDGGSGTDGGTDGDGGMDAGSGMNGGTGTDAGFGTDDGNGMGSGTATDGDDGGLAGRDDVGCACNVDDGRRTPVLLLSMLALFGMTRRSRRQEPQSSSPPTP